MIKEDKTLSRSLGLICEEFSLCRKRLENEARKTWQRDESGVKLLVLISSTKLPDGVVFH